MNEPKANRPISGFILSGGKSRRMGTDKSLLKIDGITMLEKAILLVEPFCTSVAISGLKNVSQYEKYPVISDLVPDCGPISGIYSCLKQSKTEWNFFIGVDVPFLDSTLLDFLIRQIDSADCVVPKHSAGVEPLVGLYRRRILPLVGEMIEAGTYKMTQLLSRIDTRFVDCNQQIERNPKLFYNVNTPEDFRLV